MHGIVLKGMKDFVVRNYDQETWATLHEEAGLPKRIYVPVTEYPDEIVLKLLETAVELTGIDQETLLVEFGRDVVPLLVSTYGVYVDREWTAMSLIANVEENIHEALRAMPNATFTPPAIRSRQLDDRRILLAYESRRGLCPLVRGLLVGIGEFYEEPLQITEHRCMHEGDERCVFSVTNESLVESDWDDVARTVPSRSDRGRPARGEQERGEPSREATQSGEKQVGHVSSGAR